MHTWLEDDNIPSSSINTCWWRILLAEIKIYGDQRGSFQQSGTASIEHLKEENAFHRFRKHPRKHTTGLVWPMELQQKLDFPSLIPSVVVPSSYGKSRTRFQCVNLVGGFTTTGLKDMVAQKNWKLLPSGPWIKHRPLGSSRTPHTVGVWEKTFSSNLACKWPHSLPQVVW